MGIQLHAMCYGTVPVVATTGGLVDTVKDGVTGFHMGPMDPDGLEEEDVEAMVTACIAQDLTWKKPAQKWEGVLEELMFGGAESTTTKKDTVAVPKDLVSSA